MEREFMSKMECTMPSPPSPPKRDHQSPVTFLEASNSMRDFWRLNTSTHESNHHLSQPAPQDHQMQEPAGYNTSYNHQQQQPAALYYYSTDPAYNNSALISAHTTYTNFFHNNQQQQQQQQQPEKQEFLPVYSNVYHERAAPSMPNMNRDMETLQKELAMKCPRSNDILMAITKTAEATVQEHGTPDDDDDDPMPPRLFPLSELEQDQELRAAIIEHPFYPEMVVAHVKIFKIGAPKALRNKLDGITKKFQRFQVNTTRLGVDPSLDFLMRSYVDLLGNLGDDMEEPFNKFMQFKDTMTRELEDICGHYVETNPDESDNYGYDISGGPMDNVGGGLDYEEMKEDESTMDINPYNDIDESIIIDASLPDDQLRKKLMQTYGRHIGGLKAEFNRVRKKGKLPSHARHILKEWFNHHSHWPYPSETEKQHLQRICALNLKQINNWFINERKRHWSCEGKCMHPNAQCDNGAAGNSSRVNGNLE